MRRSVWANVAPIMAVLALAAPLGGRAENGTAAPAPQPVVVSVQFFDVSMANYNTVSKDIPAGVNHDGLLAAALTKAGITPAMAPVLEIVEGVAGRVETAQDIPYDGPDGKHLTLPLVTSLGATVHRNADGTLTGDVKIHRTVVDPKAAPGPVPTTNTTDLATQCTVHDGATVLLGGVGPLVDDTAPLHLVFLKMSTAAPLH